MTRRRCHRDTITGIMLLTPISATIVLLNRPNESTVCSSFPTLLSVKLTAA